METEKITVRLNKEQIGILLALIDEHTGEHEPDFVLDGDTVVSPMKDSMDYRVPLQVHLDLWLDRNMLNL